MLSRTAGYDRDRDCTRPDGSIAAFDLDPGMSVGRRRAGSAGCAIMPPMGSVRRSGNRGFFLYLGLNVIVSAVTVLGVLALWDRRSVPDPTPFPTATIDAAAILARALPPPTQTVKPHGTPL